MLRLDGTRTEINWDRQAFEYLTTASWDAHGPLLSVQSRDHRTLLILAADPATGQTSLLHEERDPAWVELTYGAAPLRTTAGRLVRVSDLDGDRRLVVDGQPVTPDGLQVREVIGADGETVYFIGIQEPTEEHLWRYDPDQGLRPAERSSPACTAAPPTAAPWSAPRGPRRASTMTVTSAGAADRAPD